MLDPKDWLDVAQRLPVGRKVRTGHTCGRGQVLLVSNNPDKWSAWCFRCNAGGFESKTHVRYMPLEAPVSTSSGEFSLPRDITPWEDVGQLQGRLVQWLHNKGMHPDLFKPGTLFWSQGQRRLVIKVSDDLALGRYVPLYPNEQYPPKWLLYGKRETPALPPNFGYELHAPVITEDFLSSVKVNWATGRKCIALLGTSEPADLHLRLAGHKRVILWLDGDAAGQAGLRKLMRSLRWQGYTCYPVQTVLDPKEYNSVEIRRLIES